MAKIMLVVDNDADQNFLEKVLKKLKFQVISMNKGNDLSEQLIDHFPDVVFASTLGRNEKILNALGKIKEIRGKPKLVFVKQEKESSRLSPEQKKIIDGVLYSPVDPFKLIDVLANTTEVEIKELRQRYNEMLKGDRGDTQGAAGYTKVSGKVGTDFGTTQVMGKVATEGDIAVSGNPTIKTPQGTYKKPEHAAKGGEGEVLSGHQHQTKNHNAEVFDDVGESTSGASSVDGGDNFEKADSTAVAGTEATHDHQADSQTQQTHASDGGAEAAQTEVSPEQHKPISTPEKDASDGSLIHDQDRKSKYDAIVANLEKADDRPLAIDGQKLRQLQAAQSEEVSEGTEVKQNRKHFLKTLFGIKPEDVQKKSS